MDALDQHLLHEQRVILVYHYDESHPDQNVRTNFIVDYEFMKLGLSLDSMINEIILQSEFMMPDHQRRIFQMMQSCPIRHYDITKNFQYGPIEIQKLRFDFGVLLDVDQLQKINYKPIYELLIEDRTVIGEVPSEQLPTIATRNESGGLTVNMNHRLNEYKTHSIESRYLQYSFCPYSRYLGLLRLDTLISWLPLDIIQLIVDYLMHGSTKK